MRIVINVIFLIAFYLSSFAQQKAKADEGKYFQLTDSVFEIGAILHTACHIVESEWYGFGRDPLKSNDCDSLVLFLRNHPELKLEVGVHTDYRPIPMTNDTLSIYCARSLVEYLEVRGIPMDQLVAKGYAGVNPLMSDEEIRKIKSRKKQEEAHLKNRRTEIKILEIKQRVASNDIKGVWEIDRFYFSDISAMDERIASEWLYRRVTISDKLNFEFNKIATYRDVFKNESGCNIFHPDSPKIIEAVNYFDSTHAPIENLGLMKSRLRVYQTDCKDNPFGEFALSDKNELIIGWDGVFFVMVKKQ